MESATAEHVTKFDNKAVHGYVAVTRTNTEIAMFDHEIVDPFVAHIDADLSSFDNKPSSCSRACTGVILDDGPFFDEEDKGHILGIDPISNRLAFGG
jgi:hypothetical protein